ncbi:MAG: hypothetical protein HYV35_03540 [Lentisphaerae bacterium]|nr:hypothetical protein [Lentisphaerota bacterium]
MLKDGSTYKMWYTGHDTYSIYYATSSNGLEWTKYDNGIPANSDGSSTNGKIPHGITGGDVSYTWYPSVIKDGSTNKMWYSGLGGGVYNIYYATSTNGGLTWTKYDNGIPALSDGSSTNGKIPRGNAGRGDSTYALSPSVLKDGATYKMWYAGSGGGTTICVYYATSSNGLEWTKYDNTIPANSDGSSTNGKVPRGTSGRGDADGVGAPCVIKDGAAYKMWYTGVAGGTNRIFYATSPDGLIWTKLDNTIPPVSDTTNSNSRLGLGTAGKGDSKHAAHPKVVIANERWGSYQMWYSGSDGTNWRVYYAVSLPPAGTIFTFR